MKRYTNKSRNQVIHDVFIPPVPKLSASELYRRWDEALLLFALSYVFVTVISFSLLLFLSHIKASPLNIINALLHPQFLNTLHKIFWVISNLLGLFSSGYIFKEVIKPRTYGKHLSGSSLKFGEEAIKQGVYEAEKQGGGIKNGWLYIHPSIKLSRNQLLRHILISGSVGSGKTQIIAPIIEQIFKQNIRAIIYDAKGDFTSHFTKGAIISPYDSRSLVWDIGKDIRTTTQASAFAQSIIPDEMGTGKFWTSSAQRILLALTLSLIREYKNGSWGFDKLSELLNLPVEQISEYIQSIDPATSNLISNPTSTTTMGILATLTVSSKVIHDLNYAWNNPKIEKWSAVEWATSDKYKGPRQIILQAGEDSQLTKAYIASIINVIVPAVISPAFKDSQTRKRLFILDELTSIGKIPDLLSLVDKGRSKGIGVITAFQDLAQVRHVYGDNLAQALPAMVGTLIITQTMAGETRDKLAGMLGKRRVSIKQPDKPADEQEIPIVLSSDLTEHLGAYFFKGKFQGVNAILYMGGDVLELTWPPFNMLKLRDSRVNAKWNEVGFDPSKIVLKEISTSTSNEGISNNSFNYKTLPDDIKENTWLPK